MQARAGLWEWVACQEKWQLYGSIQAELQDPEGADLTGFPCPMKMEIYQLLKEYGGLDGRHISGEGMRTPKWGTSTVLCKTPRTHHGISARTWEEKATGGKQCPSP